MALYDVETIVKYYFQVEADSLQEAELEGWRYYNVKYEPEAEVQEILAELAEEEVND
jgi:hypothetical protein